MLNLLAFLFHGIQGLADEDYRGADLFLDGRTTFSGHYGTRPLVTPMKPGMICSLPSLAMSLMLEFGIAGNGAPCHNLEIEPRTSRTDTNGDERKFNHEGDVEPSVRGAQRIHQVPLLPSFFGFCVLKTAPGACALHIRPGSDPGAICSVVWLWRHYENLVSGTPALPQSTGGIGLTAHRYLRIRTITAMKGTRYRQWREHGAPQKLYIRDTW
jgi:hypothetical protein